MRRAVLPTLSVVLAAMNDAERMARYPRRREMGSITWGTRNLRGLRGLGVALPVGDGAFNISPFAVAPEPMIQPSPGVVAFLQNPDTRPGSWPGLNPAPAVVASGLPAQVPVQTPAVVVTPTSGAIPPPQAVAAAAAAPVSWLEQSLIGGIPNKYLLLGGIAGLFLFGGKHGS